MGVLHEDEFVALDGKFRQPVHHREDAVMVTRRNGFGNRLQVASGGRQDEGVLGSAATCPSTKLKIVASLPDLIAKHRAHGPAQVASTASAAQAARQAKALGKPVIVLDHFQYHRTILRL